VWFAPAGTTSFVEVATMTKAIVVLRVRAGPARPATAQEREQSLRCARLWIAAFFDSEIIGH
jgi:hypothetical protein